ncbi:sulfatase-like hydrolase/transferase [Kaistia adipata]|uniref:sulfatase-like hydrolase/transferase n=1 Tax=Kaistia adipata TaxID=166954 RepID=UPI00041121D1|nr:sulfatase-like hydrolase/transferase [Kaistia adipata]
MVLHLESIAWRTLQSFPEAFPNLNRLMPESRVYRSYFSSATSTQMVLAYLFHGNDREMDAAPGLARPAANNPSLFATLGEAGYRTEFLGVTARPAKRMLPLLAETLPPVWSTNDFGALLRRFDEATNADRFALYVWNLVTHVEHAMALASHAEGLDDLIGGACAVADHALGAMIDVLERKNLMDETVVVIFGDHGDDYWTHGFKKGLLHGVEPHTQIVHCPLLIRASSLPAGTDHGLASTIDLAATCFDLLGVAPALPFSGSGRSLVSAPRRSFAFSQNFTASQPDATDMDIRKAFAVHDASHSLMVSSRGLELYNHRLDPGNHCNLLHFFDLDRDGALSFQGDRDARPHFATAVGGVLGRDDTVRRDFQRLRGALRDWLTGKQDYVAARAPSVLNTLDPACLDRINRHGREAFFGGARDRAGRRSAAIRRSLGRALHFLLRRSDDVRP